MKDSVVSKVEEFASHHQRYQKENEVPNQHTPVVVDLVKEKEKEATEHNTAEKERDREYLANLV